MKCRRHGLGLLPEEQQIMDDLTKVWCGFMDLPVQHDDDRTDFRMSLHRLQHLLGIRVVRRDYDGWTNEQEMPVGTQGIVSVVDESDQVLVKFVAGCNGDAAASLALRLSGLKEVPAPQDLLRLAAESRFGCSGCLVLLVRNRDGSVGVYGEDTDVHQRYKETLCYPAFNPRWESGECDHVRVVEIVDGVTWVAAQARVPAGDPERDKIFKAEDQRFVDACEAAIARGAVRTRVTSVEMSDRPGAPVGLVLADDVHDRIREALDAGRPVFLMDVEPDKQLNDGPPKFDLVVGPYLDGMEQKHEANPNV